MKLKHPCEDQMSRFAPLGNLVTVDDFDRGACGWLDLTPNLNEEGYRTRPTALDKSRWGPPMLSAAPFPYVGTHGSMDGTYSLKLATKPTASAYEDKPSPGSFSHAVKRLTLHSEVSHLQVEMWYAYTAEDDRPGVGEDDVRAFGVFFDLQDDQYRWQPGIRYLNAVNGIPARRWQYMSAEDVSQEDWAYGRGSEWQVPGIDGLWYGRRRRDGTADAFVDVPDGVQDLCYNETDGKINWAYLRLLVDVRRREYVEFQSMANTYSLRGLSPTLAAPYDRIKGLVNPIVWIENDADRRVFLFLDSVVVSVE